MDGSIPDDAVVADAPQLTVVDPHAPRLYDSDQPFAALGYEIRCDQGVTVVTYTRGKETVEHGIPIAIDIKMRIRDNGVVRGVWGRLTTKDGSVRDFYVPTESMGGRDLFGKLLDATGHAFTDGGAVVETRMVQRLLISATQHQGVKAIDVLTQACWDGDQLRVPGITDIPMPSKDGALHDQTYGPPVVSWNGDLDAGDDSDAKEAWRTIMTAAAQNPKFGLLIGMTMASPYLKRVKAPNRTVHVGGVTTRGKTRLAKTAIATCGNPDDSNHGLVGTWDTTYIGAMSVFNRTGGMPYLLDETSMVSDRAEEILEQIPYAVAQGKERQRADRTGEARDVEHFWLNVLSTGERDLATSKGGAFSRVVQLNAPLIEGDDGSAVDAIYALAEEHYGWPLRWLVKSGYAPTEKDLQVPRFENPIAQRHARSLAAAKMVFDRVAFGLFGGVGGQLRPEHALDLEAATRDLVAVIDAEGSDADRLYEALWTDFVSRPLDYGSEMMISSTVIGRDCDSEWFVTMPRVQDVARRIDVKDIRPAIREMVTDGRIKRGSKGNQSRKALRTGEGIVVGYLLVKPPDTVMVTDEAAGVTDA